MRHAVRYLPCCDTAMQGRKVQYMLLATAMCPSFGHDFTASRLGLITIQPPTPVLHTHIHPPIMACPQGFFPGLGLPEMGIWGFIIGSLFIGVSQVGVGLGFGDVGEGAGLRGESNRCVCVGGGRVKGRGGDRGSGANVPGVRRFIYTLNPKPYPPASPNSRSSGRPTASAKVTGPPSASTASPLRPRRSRLREWRWGPAWGLGVSSWARACTSEARWRGRIRCCPQCCRCVRVCTCEREGG